ncbi:MAG: ribulose-phosphate 3-epimerase [Oscillospiraceae bacterium]
MPKVSPSILSCDFANIKSEIETINFCDMLHVDVMDGHFVPNISIGVPVVSSISKCSYKFLDVHLMITNPYDYIEAFSNAGADLICFHLESDSDVSKTIEKIKKCNKKVGLAIKPNTSVEKLIPFLSQIDLALVMSVEPGFGGQSFMPVALEKIKKIAMAKKNNSQISSDLLIEVDGGINMETAKQCVNSGANLLVAGSFIFNSKERNVTIKQLKNI